MSSPRSTPSSPVVAAMLCAGVVTAQFVAGKATRDALFLTHLPVTTLPTMVMATAIFSVGLVTVSSKSVARLTPARLVPLMFAANAFMLLAEWLMTFAAPRVAAVLVYLRSQAQPDARLRFWLSMKVWSRTAKRRFAKCGCRHDWWSSGGLLASVGVILNTAGLLPSWLPSMSLCAGRLGGVARDPIAPLRVFTIWRRSTFGLRVLAEAPISAILPRCRQDHRRSAVDYVFKVQAVARSESEDSSASSPRARRINFITFARPQATVSPSEVRAGVHDEHARWRFCWSSAPLLRGCKA